jgi:hypothetical protein
MPPLSAALADRAREEFVGMDSPLERIKFMWSWMTERAPVVRPPPPPSRPTVNGPLV